MGQQQLLLYILGAIMVGITIVVAITIFGSASVGSNKDSIVNDLNNLAADALRYRSLPGTLGGGGRSYVGYVVPRKLETNENASYAPTTPVSTADVISFVATSSVGYGTITAILDRDGKLASFAYTGDFL